MTRRSLAIAALLLAPCLTTACGDDEAAASAAASTAAARRAGKPRAAAGATPARTLAAWQDELLDLAFAAVSAMPDVPHQKNRCRAQETVVAACLQLDQPGRAHSCLQQIADWRRGACLADLAHWLAEHGDADRVPDLLAEASRIADQVMQADGAQEHRRDRIRAKIARTHLLLGDADRAREYEQGIADSQLAELVATKAGELAPDDFDRQLEAVDALLAAENFDPARGALWLCARLHDRFFADPARRAATEQRVVSGHPRLPVGERLLLLFDLVETALRHADAAKARELVARAQAVIDGSKWLPEDRIRVASRLAGLRARAGDRLGARGAADAALQLYDAERPAIVDIWRAGVLRALAEAFHAAGADDVAMAVYRRAAEEGTVNPNSKPRAEDLAATCLSMVVTGFEPDAALRARLHAIGSGLGNPW
jgi:hypothetical protein